MINDVVQKIMSRFNSDAFIETGLFRASTAVIIRAWFPKIKIHEIEINPEYCAYGRQLFENDENTVIHHSDSRYFLENSIDIFKDYNNPVFFLDAHWDPKNWPLRAEIENISRLESPIIIIDDFKTPGPDGKPSSDHGYDSYEGQDCDKDYIEDLIKPKTDVIFYAKKPTIDGQGSGIVFINKSHNDIKERVEGLELIMEKL